MTIEIEVQAVERTVTAALPPTRVYARNSAPEYWIVTSMRYFQHPTQEAAEVERDRLCALFPGKQFRTHRVKRRLAASCTAADIAALRNRIVELESQLEMVKS